MSTPFQKALREFDAVNGHDPRTQTAEGRTNPRELIFAKRVYAWMERLNPAASEEVRLAARSHTLRRWEVPRNNYSQDTAGYHAWRRATARHSARCAEEILKRSAYPEDRIRRVAQLIMWELFPRDPDAQLLEDADCLAFLEMKLADYLERWDEAKVRRILQGTWSKMSETARRKALDLPLDPRAKKIIAGLAASS